MNEPSDSIFETVPLAEGQQAPDYRLSEATRSMLTDYIRATKQLARRRGFSIEVSPRELFKIFMDSGSKGKMIGNLDAVRLSVVQELESPAAQQDAIRFLEALLGTG